MTSAQRLTLLRYGNAVAAVFVATAGRLALDPVLGDGLPFTTMFLAILVVGGYAGRGPALLATGLGAIASARLFLPPRNNFAVHSFEDRAGLVLYLAVGVGIALIGGMLGDARRRARSTADEVLRHREQMRITLASIGDAVIVTDDEGRVTSLNVVAEALTGWLTCEAVGQPLPKVFRIVNEETRREVENPAPRAKRESAVFGLDTPSALIARDGAERSIHGCGTAIRDAAGRIVGNVLVFRDISEKKRAEAEVRRAGDQARTILESITDAFFALDRDWRFTYINRHCEVMMGRPGDDQIGKIYWEEYPTALGTAIEENFRNAVAENVATSFEVFFEAHGRWYDSHAYPSPQGLSVYFQDVTERKRSAEEHDRLTTASERQRRIYETVLSNTSDFNYVFNLEGRFTYANATLLDLWQKGADEALGKTFLELGYPPDLAARLQSQIQQVIDTMQTVRDETPYTSHIGERQYEYIFAPVLGAGGAVESVAGSTRDITERKRAERELAELVQRLTSLVDTTPLAVIEWDANFVVTRWSGQAEAVFGWTAAELLGGQLDSLPLLYAEDMAKVEAVEAQLLDPANKFVVSRNRNTTKAGEVVSCEWYNSVIHDEGGRMVAVLSLVLDVTERVKAETSLRESEHRFHTLADSVPVHVWMDDERGHGVLANARYQDYTGQPIEAMVDGAWLAILHPDDRDRYLAEYRDAAADLAEYRAEARLRGRDGTYRWFELIGRPRFEGERFAGYVGVSLDVTERRRLEDELRRMAADLSEADRRKDEFLATLAHELRNPLAPIRNALHLMKRSGVGGPIEEERAMAERQVVHLARLIDDLMDVARISRGKIELHTDVVDLTTIVNQAVETARPLIDERRHRLTVSLPDEAIRLEGDPTRLEQILWNLLNNAAKYSEPGGEIGLTAVREGGEVVLRVCDTGIGIGAEFLPRIFEMFVQVGEYKGYSQGGLGIGLSLVRTLVEMHGGSISAHSEGPGKGSEFIVRLPVLSRAQVEMQKSHERRNGPVGTPPRRRILVVDDNIDAATTLARLLERFYQQDVRVAHDGRQALAMADEFQPEVILLDIGLPGMDGNEVARRLRERPEFANTLLVALTGWGQDSDVERSMMAGFDHHLVKPADPVVIVELLARTQNGEAVRPRQAAAS